MASSVVQSAATNGATASVTVTLGAAPTVGNTLLAVVGSDTTHNAPTAGAGRTFTQRLAQVGNMGFYVWTRLVVSGDTAAVAFTATTVDNSSCQVVEIQGTYDVIGVGLSTVNTPIASRTTNGLTPTSADNTVMAIAGMSNVNTAMSGGSANNTFTLTRANFAATTGTTQASSITTQKFTASTAATGTTTISWTGNALNTDGVQIAFTGSGGAAAPTPFRRIGKRSW